MPCYSYCGTTVRVAGDHANLTAKHFLISTAPLSRTHLLRCTGVLWEEECELAGERAG